MPGRQTGRRASQFRVAPGDIRAVSAALSTSAAKTALSDSYKFMWSEEEYDSTGAPFKWLYLVEAKAAITGFDLRTAYSDIDLLVVADDVTLEDLYSALAAVEASLDRKINPTLYTAKEFNRRRNAGNAFLTRVLAGKHMILFGDNVDIPT